VWRRTRAGCGKRLHIARGLLHDPPVLFLDEPTIGLDPVGARELRHTVASLRDAGKTVLLTTHYMFEADELCSRIGVIANGRLVATGTPAELKANVADRTVVEIEVFGVGDAVLDRLRRIDGVTSLGVEAREQAQVLLVQASRGSELVQVLLRELDGTNVGRVFSREPTLEDAYVELVQRA
jgi:ABC-2 type transport system ATP-binding protein